MVLDPENKDFCVVDERNPFFRLKLVHFFCLHLTYVVYFLLPTSSAKKIGISIFVCVVNWSKVRATQSLQAIDSLRYKYEKVGEYKFVSKYTKQLLLKYWRSLYQVHLIQYLFKEARMYNSLSSVYIFWRKKSHYHTWIDIYGNSE